MKKVLLVATVQSHIGQFHKPLAKMLQEHGCEVHVAAKNNLAEKNGLCLEYVDKVFDIPFSRSPFRLKNVAAYKAVKHILRDNTYDVIHTNTPIASALTRIAAQKYRKQGTAKVFYTAHGFHFYCGAPWKSWLMYYPVELMLSRWTDTLITINKEDYERAKCKFRARKTAYMPGVGVELSKFDFDLSDAEKSIKRAEIGVPEDAFLIMSVGELNRNKNHEVILRALQLLGDTNIHYCIAGNGLMHDDLLRMARELGVSERVHLLGYRREIPVLYKVSDVCCFPSIREGLGLAAVEAMASGLPVIAADNRGTRDLIINGKNGFLCKYSDAKDFAEKLRELYIDAKLREELGRNAKETSKIFGVEHAVCALKGFYEI